MSKNVTKNKSLITALFRGMSAILVVVVIMSLGARSNPLTYAAQSTPNINLTPATGTYTTGQTVTVTVNEDSGSTSIYTAQADITFPTSLLTYTTSSCNSSTFGVSVPPTVSSGTVDMTCGSTSALTGAQVIGTITFTASNTAAGTANVTLATSCQGTSTANCSAVLTSNGTTETNINPTVYNASYTLQIASGSGGGGGGGSTTPPPTPPSTPPVTTKKPTGTTTSTSKLAAGSLTTPAVTVTPSTGVAQTVVPDNSSVTTNTPVAVQPATTQTQGVASISYYLNGKLAYIATLPPYTYHMNTSSLLNGKYTLTSKTVYTNGTTATATQHIKVANPISLEQAELFTRHYLLLPVIIICALLALGFVLRRYMLHHHNDDNGSGGGSGLLIPQTGIEPIAPTIIRPTVINPERPKGY